MSCIHEIEKTWLIHKTDHDHEACFIEFIASNYNWCDIVSAPEFNAEDYIFIKNEEATPLRYLVLSCIIRALEYNNRL